MSWSATTEMGEPPAVRAGRDKAQAVRYGLDLGGAPIRDLFGFIERHFGVLVARQPMPDGPEGALMRHGDRWLIAINTWENFLARQRFTAAHELGHYLFDGDRQPIVIDENVYGRPGNPVEIRANAFAVHLLLPADVLRATVATSDFDIRSDENVVGLAMEYGVSLQSLSWHMKNVCGLPDRERRRIGEIEIFHVASRMGLADRVERERAARGARGWPRRYISLVAKAFDGGRLTEDDVREYLDEGTANVLLNDTRM